MTKRRRWEILIWPIRYWQFHLLKPYGYRYRFLTETWIGPICLRVWEDARSAGGRAIRRVR
jgi:hypothetical protein